MKILKLTAIVSVALATYIILRPLSLSLDIVIIKSITTLFNKIPLFGFQMYVDTATQTLLRLSIIAGLWSTISTYKSQLRQKEMK